VVTGCYAERSPDEIRGIPGVDLVLSNREKFFIGEYLSEFDGKIPLNPPLRKGESGSPPLKRGVRGDFIWHPPIVTFDGQTRALVKIEDGCDSFCTYCIVPHVRGGTIRSRPIDSIVREVRALAGNGYREAVLTGVHLGAYGRDLADGTKLAHVLRALHDVDGIQRIRLSSIEPMDISDDLIGEMARLPKCAHHFHVSLQSGSDKILKLMRRGYASAEFEDVVNRIRRAIPDVGISTDVMVGFPGETERDFRDTCDLIARVKFSRLHAFRYSPREGTPAAEFPDQVQEAVASRRSREVRALGDSLAREFRSRMLGQEAQVLVEDTREGKDKLLAGFTGNYVRVLVADAPDELAGRMVRVKLMNMENEYLMGLMGSGF
jgi:threonylcarbamoyladenosine tRNA methylthiotransferase MtaB